jgi:hypothetical protein
MISDSKGGPLFIDAAKMEASHEVDDSFPDSLREPILRKVQHSTISRIDNLGALCRTSTDA